MSKCDNTSMSCKHFERCSVNSLEDPSMSRYIKDPLMDPLDG